MSPELVEATRRQLAHWRAALSSGAERVGWKIGFNAPAVQESLGLPHSVVGHLTTATLVGADGAHSLAGAKNPLAEPEVAILVGPDHSIAGLSAAIEVIDMDAIPGGPDEVPGVIEHNIFHRAVAIGPAREQPGARRGDLLHRRRGGRHAPTPPRWTCPPRWRSWRRSSRRRASSLEAGDRIIAGTLTPPQPVRPGGTAALDLGALGNIDIGFTH